MVASWWLAEGRTTDAAALASGKFDISIEHNSVESRN
jgi:hypothetical protein